MSRYDLMRQFADSWALLGMCLLFLGFVGWTFRPGASRHHDEAARMIFRPDNRPENRSDSND